MQFDQATISLSPMNTGHCLDMGFRMFRAHFAPILQGWCLFAIPSCVGLYLAIDRLEWGLPAAAALYALTTSLFGAYLIAGIAPAAFGVPFTFSSTWSLLARDRFRPLFVGLGSQLLVALASLLCLIPGLLVAVRLGFLLEQRALKPMERRTHERGVRELVKNGFGDLAGRAFFILAFLALIWLVLFVTVDQAGFVLFKFPLGFSRIAVDSTYMDSVDYTITYIASYFWNDPIVVTTMYACALAVFPLGRLAWFFCYIDLRVRQDCWDMELQILQEAERLEGRTA